MLSQLVDKVRNANAQAPSLRSGSCPQGMASVVANWNHVNFDEHKLELYMTLMVFKKILVNLII